MITTTLLFVLVSLIALRVPVSISIGISTVIALIIGDFPLSVVPRMMIDGLDTFTLLAVPFFVLAGNIMNAGGVTERIFSFAKALFSPIRGGLAQVNVAASMIFAGMSGAAVADLAGLGTVEMRAMRKGGYPLNVAAAVTLASCTIGPIIPPSIVLIVYGLATDTSIGRLFLGGIIPGFIIGLITMVWISLWVRFKKTSWGQPEPFVVSDVWSTFKGGALALFSPVLIIGALVLGVSTPTEVGVIAATYALFVGIIYRDLTWKKLLECIVESMQTTAIIMYIVAVSIVMGWIITMERLPHEAAKAIQLYIEHPLLALLIINVFLILVGMFLETLPAILILSPILLPILAPFGIDQVHFGVIICFNLIIGIITPPMGIGLFVAARVADTTPELVLKATMPFLIPLLFGLAIVTAFPILTLWLPDLVFGPRP